MEDYILYGEVGRGAVGGCVAYKGRRASIVAADEADARTKFAASARCDHPALCHVYKWCTTGSESWVVMDLCAGGDLNTLLQYDGPLSLEAVRDYAVALMAPVQHAHSRGLVACDLRPSRFLIDDGRLRLGSLSRSLAFAGGNDPVPSSRPGTATSAAVPSLSRDMIHLRLRQLQQRDPAYISPELAEYGHLTPAADMWALGCLLWTMLRVGRTAAPGGAVIGPFSDFAPLPNDDANLVHEARGLLRQLLNPNPKDRAFWPDLQTHPWINGRLPLEPGLEDAANVIRMAFSPSVSATLERATRSSDEDAADSLNASSAGSSTLHASTVRSSVPHDDAWHSRESTPLPSHADSVAVSLLEVESSSVPPDALSKNRSNTLRLSRSFMGTRDVFNNPASATSSSAVAASKHARQAPDDRQAGLLPATNAGTASGAATASPTASPYGTPKKVPAGGRTREPIGPPTLSHVHLSVRESSALESLPLPRSGLTGLRGVPFKKTTPDSVAGEDGAVAAHVPHVLKLEGRILDTLLITTSDLAVQPVLAARNKALRYDARSLGFPPLKLEDWATRSAAALAAHLAAVAEALGVDASGGARRGSARTRGGGPESRSKNHVLAYLHTAAASSDNAANVLVNSPLFVGMASSFRALPDYARERLALVIATIVRQATDIQLDVPMGLVLHKLADALRDLFRDVPVKKMLVAALGETLFYVVTQASTAEAPPHWAVPPIVYQMLQRCMRPDEDVGVLVHAVRTVENIATVAGPHCASLARNDIVLMLWALIAHAKQAALRRACVAAVFHLSCIDPALLQHLVDKAGVPALADLLRDTSPRARQAALSLLLLPFSEQSSLPRAETALMESEELVAQVIRALRAGPSLCRGKAYLLLSSLALPAAMADHPLASSHQDASLSSLSRACNLKLLHELERDDNERQEPTHDHEDLGYNLECAAWMAVVCARAVPRVLQRLLLALQPLAGRQHPSTAQAKIARDVLLHIEVTVQLVRAGVVRHLVDLDAFVAQLAATLTFAGEVLGGSTSLHDVAPDANETLTSTAFALLELLLQGEARLTLETHQVRLLWEAVVPLVSVDHEQSRLVALQSTTALLALPALSGNAGSEAGDGQQTLLNAHEGAALAAELLPRIEQALSAPEPVPSFAAKATRQLLEVTPAARATLEELGITAVALRALQPQVTPEFVAKRAADPTGTARAPPEGAADGTALAWLASEAVAAQAGGVLFLCEEYGLAWKIAAALSGLVASGIQDEEHQRAILVMAHYLVSAAVRAARTALQQRANDLTASESNSAAIANTEGLLRQSSILLHALSPLLNLAGSESPEVAFLAARIASSVLQLHAPHYVRLLDDDCAEFLAAALRVGPPRAKRVLLRLLHKAMRHDARFLTELRASQVLRAVLHRLARGGEMEEAADTAGEESIADLAATLTQACE